MPSQHCVPTVIGVAQVGRHMALFLGQLGPSTAILVSLLPLPPAVRRCHGGCPERFRPPLAPLWFRGRVLAQAPWSAAAGDPLPVMSESSEATKASPIGQQGLPPEGAEVRFDYRDEIYSGIIGGGVIRLTGSHDGTYKTFSAASRAITGTSRNGWRDWSVRLPGKEDWVIAGHWRTQASISNLTLLAASDGEGGHS